MEKVLEAAKVQKLKEYEARKAAPATKSTYTPSSSRQFTLEEMIDRTRKWETSDPHSVHISTRTGEMIAHDCQPFSIVLISLLYRQFHHYTCFVSFIIIIGICICICEFRTNKL